ncbi:hypothetical protein UFOVP1290_300 [uncultured Caudovirales phage]|uniref:Uncharacterized protein n=1 Tax=uncultured Caudovirales phage TaxID=2100421 RepID=A0A6J5RGY9_9CAUD|nr:hypothetical protein UFOVP1290_300 [uncultured Caudovirales phage]
MYHFVIFVFAIFNMVLRGVIIKTYWSWFLIPVFNTMPHISTLQAIGFSFLVSIFYPVKSLSQRDMDEAKNSSSSLAIINGVIYTLIMLASLLVAWIFHSIM